MENRKILHELLDTMLDFSAVNVKYKDELHEGQILSFTHTGTVEFLDYDSRETIEVELKDIEFNAIKEVKHMEDIFPRLCDWCDHGMCDGWYLEGTYISSSEYLSDYLKETYNKTADEFWGDIGGANDGHYWTEWHELEDMEDEAYLFDGTKLTCIDFSELLYEDAQGQKYKIIKED